MIRGWETSFTRPVFSDGAAKLMCVSYVVTSAWRPGCISCPTGIRFSHLPACELSHEIARLCKETPPTLIVQPLVVLLLLQ